MVFSYLGQLHFKMIYSLQFLKSFLEKLRRSLHGVMSNMLDCEMVMIEFKLHSHY